MTILKSPEL